LFGHGGKILSTHTTNDLARVSVSTEDGSQQSATFTHALKGLALVCSIIPLAAQHFPTHFKSYKLSTKPNLVNNKRRHPQALLVLQKAQTTK
jgi:hypothetical protein